MREVNRTIERWERGDKLYRATWQASLDPAVFPDPASPAVPAMPAGAMLGMDAGKVETPSISEAIGSYLASVKRNRPNATEKDTRQTESHLRSFEQAFGAATPIGTIDRRQAGRFFEALQKLPAHFTRRKALDGLDVFAAADKAVKLGLTPMLARTVNSRVGDVRSMYGDAVKRGAADVNPFDGMSLAEKGYEESERGWSFDQLGRILAHPIMRGCASERDVFVPGNHLLNDWRFWSILIAATSGARIGEVAQLRPEDVMQNEGVWVLNISREGGRTTKNRASIRRTPVHSEVLRVGLVGLAMERQRAAEALLLPGVPKPVQGNASHGLTKWMGEKARAKLAPDAKTGQGWHSFRHTMQELSRETSNPDSVSDRLAGRTPAGAGGRYGKYPPRVLQAALEKIRMPDALRMIPARYAPSSTPDQ